MNKLLLIVLLLTIITSCSDEYNLSSYTKGTHQKKLCITTKILSTKSITLTEQFSAGSTMGLYITSEKKKDLRTGNCKFKNVKALAINSTDKAIKWKLLPEVYLKDTEMLKIYAYHPYQNNHLATHIPIYISPVASLTKDYMYGKLAKGHKPVNIYCPYVLLSMRHALSLIEFQIKLNKNISGLQKLNAIQISNKAGGNMLHTKGTLDVTTGNITYYNNSSNVSTLLKTDHFIPLKHELYEKYKILVMPTDHPTINKGDIEILFIINEKSYKYLIPEQTQWKKGHKYLYEFLFNGKDIVLEKLTITNWHFKYNKDSFIPTNNR